jgi:hypothetical protein
MRRCEFKILLNPDELWSSIRWQGALKKISQAFAIKRIDTTFLLVAGLFRYLCAVFSSMLTQDSRFSVPTSATRFWLRSIAGSRHDRDNQPFKKSVSEIKPSSFDGESAAINLNS